VAEANVNEPGSVERVYQRDAFEQDAGLNAKADTAVLHGLRVTSGPDESGRFSLARAKRQTGEADRGGDSAFLPAFIAQEPDAPGMSGRDDRDYAAFVARVIALARELGRVEQPIGPDARLRGFHGG
jgi:hypothetical protein